MESYKGTKGDQELRDQTLQGTRDTFVLEGLEAENKMELSLGCSLGSKTQRLPVLFLTFEGFLVVVVILSTRYCKQEDLRGRRQLCHRGNWSPVHLFLY